MYKYNLKMAVYRNTNCDSRTLTLSTNRIQVKERNWLRSESALLHYSILVLCLMDNKDRIMTLTVSLHMQP